MNNISNGESLELLYELAKTRFCAGHSFLSFNIVKCIKLEKRMKLN